MTVTIKEEAGIASRGSAAESASVSIHDTPASVISLTDLIHNVKDQTGDLVKYLPDAMLNEEQLQAKNRALQHAVKNAVQINAMYDDEKNVSGTYVMGAYATDDKGREFVVTVTVEQNSGNISEIGIYEVAHALNGRQKRGTRPDTKSQGVNPITHTSSISIEGFLYIVKDTVQTALSDDVLLYFNEGQYPLDYYRDRVKYRLRRYDALRYAQYDVNSLRSFMKRSVP